MLTVTFLVYVIIAYVDRFEYTNTINITSSCYFEYFKINNQTNFIPKSSSDFFCQLDFKEIKNFRKKSQTPIPSQQPNTSGNPHFSKPLSKKHKKRKRRKKKKIKLFFYFTMSHPINIHPQPGFRTGKYNSRETSINVSRKNKNKMEIKEKVQP